MAVEDWTHGQAKDVCKHRNPMSMQPMAEIMDRSNNVDPATTLIHEYAHAELHFDVVEPDEQAKREVEAEAVAHAVGRYFGLAYPNSAFDLAAWAGENLDTIQEGLERIS